MALSKKCGNCANACMLNIPFESQLGVVYCTQWSETVSVNHGCTAFIEHETAKYCHLQDFQTGKINRHNYPLDDLNL